MKPITVLLPLLLLAGCTSAAKQAHLPDGRVGHSIRCWANMSGCTERAGEICGAKGYDVVHQQASPQASSVGGIGTAGTDYTMLIACRP
jgi:hypothetical protein